MKSPLAGVTVVRFVHAEHAGEARRASHTAKTWASALELIHERATSPDPAPGLYFRPRWANGLALWELPLGLPMNVANGIEHLGDYVRGFLTLTYAKKSSRSMKAVVAREVLARCSFTDDTSPDAGEDARTLDAATRALETCFPDHAAVYAERIRSWMLHGGGVR